MRLVCLRLEQMGEPLSNYNALEFFARTGDWQTKVYYKKIKSLCAWEIDPEYEIKLRNNFPEAEVIIGDSYQTAKKEYFHGRFEFIVFDNPQNIFGKYCEHFEALPLVKRLISNKGVVIFNVNLNPFDYENNYEWAIRRSNYYGQDASLLDIDFVFDFYKNKFEEMGLVIRFMFEQQRNKEYLSYIVVGLSNS